MPPISEHVRQAHAATIIAARTAIELKHYASDSRNPEAIRLAAEIRDKLEIATDELLHAGRQAAEFYRLASLEPAKPKVV